MSDDPPLFLRRAQVFAWLCPTGLSVYQVRLMLEDGTIRSLPRQRPNERARYSREQIRRDVLAKLIECGNAGCDTSQSAAAREVKAKQSEGSNG